MVTTNKLTHSNRVTRGGCTKKRLLTAHQLFAPLTALVPSCPFWVQMTRAHICNIQVDKVKLVLCRFVKSQLDGKSLTNAFRKAGGVITPSSLSEAAVKADKIVAALSK